MFLLSGQNSIELKDLISCYDNYDIMVLITYTAI